MSEIFTAEGVAKAVRKDAKGFQLDNGEWYSGFNPLTIKKGDRVKVSYKVNGDFKNIDSFDIITKAPETSAPSAPKRDYHLSPEQVRTNAVDLALRTKTELALTALEAIEVAKTYEKYLWGGE